MPKVFDLVEYHFSDSNIGVYNIVLKTIVLLSSPTLLSFLAYLKKIESRPFKDHKMVNIGSVLRRNSNQIATTALHNNTLVLNFEMNQETVIYYQTLAKEVEKQTFKDQISTIERLWEEDDPTIRHFKNYPFKDMYNIDDKLRDIPEFITLPEAIKLRIINLEFLQNYNTLDLIDPKELENLITQLTKNRLSELEKQEKNIADDIRNKIQKIEPLYRVLETINKEINNLISKGREKILEELLRYLKQTTDIEKINIASNTIHLITTPLLLNFDQEKALKSQRIKEQVKEHIKKEGKFAIGRYTITITMENKLAFIVKPLNYPHINRHINIGCYGQREKAIQEARLEGNIAHLISHLIAALKGATVNDGPGNNTINGSIFIEKDGLKNVENIGKVSLKRYIDEYLKKPDARYTTGETTIPERENPF